VPEEVGNSFYEIRIEPTIKATIAIIIRMNEVTALGFPKFTFQPIPGLAFGIRKLGSFLFT